MASIVVDGLTECIALEKKGSSSKEIEALNERVQDKKLKATQ